MIGAMTNPNDLARRLAELFRLPGYRPLPERDLAKRLLLPSGQRGALRRALRDMAEQGAAATYGGGRWGAPTGGTQTITGTYQARLNGSGWLLPDTPDEKPCWLEPASILGAVHGDRIAARFIPRTPDMWIPGARPETKAARLTQILERPRAQAVGTVQWSARGVHLLPRDPLLPTPIMLTDPPAKLKPLRGHLILASLSPAPAPPTRPVTARFQEDLGQPDDPHNDIPALLKDHGVEENFPLEVQRAARQVATSVRRTPGPRRVDLRDRLILTIDPASAHDQDDAISIARLPDGRWQLGVHIADVAAYVEPDSAIDREARRRGNSTYLVDRVIRMLPRDLTVKVCSLRPNEDHLAHTVELIFDDTGRLHQSKTYRSLIRTRAALSYEAVQRYFDTGAWPELAPEIRATVDHLRHLAGQIRARRFEAGALDFAMPEVQCILDAQGTPTGFQRRDAIEAYVLIEECMLAANQVVARKIRAAGLPAPYRIHLPPTPEKWARMASELHALGIRTTPARAADLNRIARRVAGQPAEHMVTLAMLRNMPRAIYAADCQPHFGLGFDCYAHFTSPIRRYPDLVLHRVLLAIEEGRPPPYSAEEIASLARHCSDTEAESAELEAESILLKRIQYYAAQMAQGRTGPFAGSIIALNPKGLLVELNDSLQTGLLPYRALGRQQYVLAADGLAATALRGKTYRLGQTLHVQLATVDEKRRRIDFAPADLPTPRAPAKKKCATPDNDVDTPQPKTEKHTPTGQRVSGSQRRKTK